MKAWIYIYTIVLAAGMVTALADETKTNTQTGATTSTPQHQRVAVPPPMPAPRSDQRVKPPAVVPLMQTSAVPVQSNITLPTDTDECHYPIAHDRTSAPAPAVTNEMKPPAVAHWNKPAPFPLKPNITKPATPTNAAAPPPESSGIGHKGVWAGGVVILAGGLWRFSCGGSSHASSSHGEPDHEHMR